MNSDNDVRQKIGSTHRMPEREDHRRQGLHAKYYVEKDGEEVTDCFVLEPQDDPAAREALIAYAQETDNDALAEDLEEWVVDICTRGEASD